MMRSGVLYLVAESPETHGVFDPPTETQRMVYCTIKSVGYQEYYRAMENALRPSLVFVLADYAEYQDEKTCVYEGKRYQIIRTYITAQQTIELTVEEAKAYVG